MTKTKIHWAFSLQIGASRSLPVRVFPEDTDAAGWVFHANYLRFLDRGRTDLLSSAGFSPADLAREGLGSRVAGVSMVFHRAAKLDDVVNVRTEIAALDEKQIEFSQRIERGPELLIEAKVTVLTAGGPTGQ